MSDSLQRVSVEERIRRYLLAMDAPRRDPADPQDSHTVVFNAARALLHGFGLTPFEARPFFVDYLSRSDLPWSEGEINHKLRSVDAQQSKWPRGYLRKDNEWKPSAAMRRDLGIPTEEEVRKKINFELERLQRIAAPWRDRANLAFLANRSLHDPAAVDAGAFLKLLYNPGERVLCFTNEYTQGDAVWPDEPPPTEGRVGVWYLPQPVTGEYLPNPEGKPGPNGEPPKPSRRIGKCVTAWRYLVLESDEAPMRDWLGFIVQAPLRVEAIYTSGSRSIHVLVRIDGKTYDDWHAKKNAIMPFLLACIMMGGDKNTFGTGVRLSRLPGCLRHGKMVPQMILGKPLLDAQGRPVKRWEKYKTPGEQKLLYFRPGATTRPICELPPERDVESWWTARGRLAIDGYEDNLAECRRGLRYYANVSAACALALRDLEEGQ